MDTSARNNKDFVSVVIPWFNRPNYVEQEIESIHKFADFPFELIIHDDSSIDGADLKLLEHREKISTLILQNNYRQLGLSRSLNNVISLASSEYIIIMNSDCILVDKCFSDVRNVLMKPYVGFVGLEVKGRSAPYICSNDTIFKLEHGVGSGSAFAFRRSFFDEVGGFDDMIHSGCSDCPIMYKSWYHGYFRAIILRENKVFRNLSNEIGTRDGTIGKTGYDCGHPKIFNVNDYNAVCRERRATCDKYWHDLESKRGVGNWADLHYWHDYSKGVVDKGEINWDNSFRHGQDKWREAIEKDMMR